MLDRCRRFPRAILAAVLAVAACSSSPGSGGGTEPARPPKAGIERARELFDLGEFLEAREVARSLLQVRPEDRDAGDLVRGVERLAGVQGLPSEAQIRERVILFEILSHLSAGQDLFQKRNDREAADQLERGLREIERYSLQNKFPRALRANVEEMLRKANSAAR